MKNNVKLQGSLKRYYRWPVFITILFVLMNIVIFRFSVKAGGVAAVFLIIYILITLVSYYNAKRTVFKDLVNFGIEYAQMQKVLLKEFALPYCLSDEEGRIMWMNNAMKELLEKEKNDKSISAIFPEIQLTEIFNDSTKAVLHLEHYEQSFQVEIKKLSMQKAMEGNDMVDLGEEDGYIIAYYFFDETQVKQLVQENIRQKMVAGLIYIDNYDEALESVENVKRSVLSALIERKIHQFVLGMEGVVKKTEKDKYFFAIKQQYVSHLQSSKFAILDDIKAISIGNEMAVTLSIGLGMNGKSYVQNSEYARIAIDLALGRGGDQAVLKDGEKLYYYGGKTRQVEKNNRVKARVKAHALRELINEKEDVFVMGHKLADEDAFGAAVGIVKACHVMGKQAHIVIDDITNSLRPIVERVQEDQEYREIFVRSEDAIEMVRHNSLVVVVDVNRPSYTECPELLKISKGIVVIDHHRQTSEVLEGALLSYIEPYASSSCEMVAEILQYIQDGIRLRQVEADAMYAGILLDTKNFSNKVGVRTFEAAAFLRKNGADVSKIRMLFRNNLVDFKAIAEAVRNAELFRDVFVITQCPSGGLESPTIVGAQAANELLNINGIKASFVITDFNDKIYISARSIDDINVQLIMERLGGGGHMNMAGAQLEGVSRFEARQIMKDTLRRMQEEGDL